MKHNLNILLLIAALVFMGQPRAFAQNANACNNNYQTLCSNPAVSFTSVGGTGLTGGLNVSNPVVNPQPTNANGGPANNGCMFTNVPNPQWFLLHVTSTGTLGFSLGASNSACPQSGFLHWIMWPYSPTACANIFNNTLPPVACNFNFTPSGGTGMGPVQGIGNVGNYQPAINVTQGTTYILLVSNGTGINPTCVSYSTTSAGQPGGASISCNPFTVSDATVCPTQAATVTPNWLGATNVTYSVYAPAGANVVSPAVSNSSVIVVSSPAAGVYIYTVNVSGTNAFNQPITATTNFSLTITPTVALSVAHATNYCFDACASISVTPGTGTFTIVGPSMGPPPFVNSPFSICNLQQANAGTYTVTGNLASGCSGTQTLQVNVAPNSFITLSNTSPYPVCQNNIAQVTASMPTATSYTWRGPNNYSVVVNNGTGIFSASAQSSIEGTYTVYANINYNGITCLRQATIEVQVVNTGTFNVTPSYTYCQGETITLSGSASGSPVNYQWQGPNGFSYNSPNTPSVVLTNSATNSHVGNYNFSAFYTNNSINCQITTVVNVQVVSVNPVIVLMPPQGLVCQYSNANMAVSAVGAVSYTWTGPNGFPGGSTTSTYVPNAQPNNSGVYCVQVTYAIGAKTCTNEGCNQLTVIPVNSITVVPEIVTCYPGLNSNVGLYSSAIGATSYSWAGPNSYTANTANSTIYYAPLNASGLYTVTATFTAGGLTCINTNTVNVSVNPVISFTLPGYLQTCPGKSVTLSGPANAVSYTWSASAGISSLTPTNGQNLTLTDLKPEQSGQYVLQVSSTGSCVSSRTVDLSVLTPITWSLQPQGRTICKGDTVLLEAGVMGGSEMYDYQWNPTSYLNTPVGPVVTGMPFGTTVYNVLAHDIACPDLVLSHAFTIVVKQPPEPKLELTQTEGCQPLRLYYDAKTADAAITTFDFGGVIKMQADSGKLGWYTLNNPGVYNLRILSEGRNGCIGVFNYPAPIVVYPKSNSEISWTPDVPTTNENVVSFSPIVKAGNVVAQDWMFTGTGSTGYDTTDVKYPQRRYENTGKFPVMLISVTDQGCIDTTVSIIEIRDELNIFIPNSFTPNNDGINDLFQVKGLGFKAESFILEIFDRWGHVAYTTKDLSKGWDGTIKGQSPMEGVYIYKVRIIGANGEGRKEYIGHVTLVK